MTCECEGKGIVTRTVAKNGVNYTTVLRCYCEKGQSISGTFFMPSDREHEKPIPFPMAERPGGIATDRKTAAAGGDE